MTCRILVLGLLLLMTRSAFAAEPPKTLDELRQRIEKTVTEYKVPAIGIALVDRTGPVWVAGWGKADLASGRAADQDTLFRIGSVSKMFAALAVLKLVEEGKLSLDDKVRDRAPDVAFENPWEATHPVRISHLLEHTTGWDDAHLAEYAFAAPDTMTIKQGLDFHPDSRTSRWPPGSRHAYNNIGPAVAAYIVEKITGQRFEDHVAATFFTPLGMPSTSYFRTKLYDERGATLYQGGEPVNYWQIIHRPAGSVNSSARDMAKFLHFLVARGASSPGPLVSQSSFDRMEAPATLPGNAAGVLAGYGLYNYTSGHQAWRVAFHGHDGGVMGGLTQLAYVPERGEGYVFMINAGNGAALGQISELLKGYLLRNEKWIEAQPAPLPEKYRQLDGLYEMINPRNDNMRIMNSLMSFQRVTHDDKYLHRSPLFAGWTSNDYVGAGEVLIDQWTGLPTIAIVDDPQAGPALQVASDLFQPVAAWKVYARIGVPLLMIVMTIVGLIMFIVWALQKKTDTRLWLRLWPLIASASLICYVIGWALVSQYLELMGTVSFLSVGLFVLSILYPAASLFGAASLFSAQGRQQMNLHWWFAAAFVAVHLLIAGYMASFGSIAVRSWA